MNSPAHLAAHGRCCRRRLTVRTGYAGVLAACLLVPGQLGCSSQGNSNTGGGVADPGADAGLDTSTEAAPDGAGPGCGDGVVSPSESCDTALAGGSAGVCPTSCDDAVACTHDSLQGANCTVRCSHVEIDACTHGDGCCPAGCDTSTDHDCSASCGNGTIEPGESCDTAIAQGSPGACPSSCGDATACTVDDLVGAGCSAGCSHVAVTACASGDGCCPPGCDASSDSDCSTSCGNGTVEAGETCDTAIAPGSPGACPSSCNDSVACTSDLLVGSGCSSACSHESVTGCASGDGCCPAGCNEYSDGDCQPQCGNGTIDVGEECDTAIPQGQPGACPSACDDGSYCTADFLDDTGGSCSARCVFNAIHICTAWDGCCPAGCNASTDSDCLPGCGNGVVDPGETCDTAISSGTGACPTSCDDNLGCSKDHLEGSGCSSTCSHTWIDSCGPADGCCPFMCASTTDSDCVPACGDGVLDPGEACDVAVQTGQPGACPTTCNDGVVCTKDTLVGAGCSKECSFTPIVTCVSGDGCCPAGCAYASDHDCPCVPTTSCDALNQTCNSIPDDGCGTSLVCGPACDTWQQVTGHNDTYRFAMDRSGPHTVIRFGGWAESGNTAVNGTYEYDAATDTWTRYNESGVRPLPRHSHTMAYAGSGRLVMTGGTHAADADTWEYDAASHTWTPIPAAGGPGAGGDSSSYAGNGKVLMTDDMTGSWLYQVSSHSWTKLSDDAHGTRPMAWTGNGSVLAVGNDVAELFDPASQTWTDISSTAPYACIHRIESRLAYAGGSLVLVFGGRNGPESFQATIRRTCSYDAATNSWVAPSEPAALVSRNQHGLAFVGAGRSLLFGGYSYPTATVNEAIRGDAWIFYSGRFTDTMP